MKKVILGMALAGLAMVAYKKVPFVHNVGTKIGNATMNGAKKVGEWLAKKTEVKAETIAETPKAE